MPKEKKAKKVKKTKAPRKAQPLPKSVQALLKYLGGSDVKVGGGARGGQPAQLAPTSINIAVSQQQQQQQQQSQQQQQQQFATARVAPKGQIIGQSPLAAAIPQQTIIYGMQQRLPSIEDEKKKEEQLQKAQEEKDLINRKFALLEASQKDFQQFAEGKYWEVKNDIRRRIAGDPNMFDGSALAAKNRPVVEDPQFEGVSVGEEAAAGAFTAPQYIENVSNPQMTPIQRPTRKPGGGRKPDTPEVTAQKQKAKNILAQLKEQLKAELKAQTAKPVKLKGTTASMLIPQSSAQLLEETMTKEGAMKSIASAAQPSVPQQERISPTTLFRPINIQQAAPDTASQIGMMQAQAAGGAEAAPQSQGQSLQQMMKKKK